MSKINQSLHVTIYATISLHLPLATAVGVFCVSSQRFIPTRDKVFIICYSNFGVMIFQNTIHVVLSLVFYYVSCSSVFPLASCHSMLPRWDGKQNPLEEMSQFLAFDFQKPCLLKKQEETWGLNKRVGNLPEETYLSFPPPA